MAALLARMRLISGADKLGPVFPAARGRAHRERAFKSAWPRLMAEGPGSLISHAHAHISHGAEGIDARAVDSLGWLMGYKTAT